MDDKLIRRCIALPKEEKLILIKHLQCTMMDEREDDGSRFHTLFKAATAVVGGGIISDSKLKKPVIGRMMIAYKMREEGYSFKTIAEYMKISRASIRALRNNMDDALSLPRAYKYELECWNKFNDYINDKD